MRTLITGAAGFIGWNLAREIRRRHRGEMIVGVDDLSTGQQHSATNLDKLVVEDAGRWVDHQPFDTIYHLASPASPVKYQRRPLRTIQANVDGLWRCLEQLAPGGTIFFASSSEVYGDPMISPQPESYRGMVNCVGPRSCYDEAKRLGETICYEWARAHPEHGVKIARLFNVYGPGMLPDDGRCMSSFIWDSMCGRPCTIYGDGLQTRAFTYVDNVVRAIVDLVENTGQFVGPINIGTDVETTVRDMAVAVMAEAAAFRKRRGLFRLIPAPEYLPSPVDDPRQRLPDLTLAREVLGWDPRKLIQHSGPTGGIARTIKYFEATHWEEDGEIEAIAESDISSGASTV